MSGEHDTAVGTTPQRHPHALIATHDVQQSADSVDQLRVGVELCDRRVQFTDDGDLAHEVTVEKVTIHGPREQPAVRSRITASALLEGSGVHWTMHNDWLRPGLRTNNDCGVGGGR